MANEKIIVKDQWAEKFLREAVWMPFGSMCNFLGQAYQGKGVDTEVFETQVKRAFELAMKFTEEAFNRVSQGQEEKDLPVKKV